MAPWDFTYEVHVQRQNYEEFQDGDSRASNQAVGPFKYGIYETAQVPCPSSRPCPQGLTKLLPMSENLAQGDQS